MRMNSVKEKPVIGFPVTTWRACLNVAESPVAGRTSTSATAVSSAVMLRASRADR